ncbi:OmpA family protein [Thalassorhabdomicrobium marinisediminis]|uniref:OmpA family protein n=1 Tax=Thalassorhabdomicrobium marinisediminis TaxID=2170577 RepID=UPI0011B26E8A|nr:OmpA family protein [Thalassorhabdomicrobium marinisediminis]
MRKLLGCVVFGFGISGLGLWATTSAAPRIEGALAEVARQAAAPDALQTEVRGRDLRVTGTVTDLAAYVDRLAEFERIDGLRQVAFEVETLPLASPYELTLRRTEEGAISVAGPVPDDAAKAALIDGFPDGDEADLTLATGAPDEDWAEVVATLAEALAPLRSGEVMLSDRAITLAALAPTPREAEALQATLDALPKAYTVADEIEVEDDGTPLRLSLTLDDGRLSGQGKVPADLPEAVSEVILGNGAVDVTQSVRTAENTAWPAMARAAIEALGALVEGRLEIEGDAVTLTGSGAPDAVEKAQAMLGEIPDAFDVTQDLTVVEEVQPVGLVMDWDGETATATGAVPEGFVPNGPAGVEPSLDLDEHPQADGAVAFRRNADAGIAALALLDTGRVQVDAEAIHLTGTATTPQVAVLMDDVLASVADSVTITRDITYLDDGSPAAWTLRFSTTDGAHVEGRLPAGLSVADMEAALGVEIAGAPAVAAEDSETQGSLGVLDVLSEVLPEVETLTFAREGGGSALDLVATPGVELDVMAVDLAEKLPATVAFSIAPSDVTLPEGSTRRNATTGLEEVFTGKYWLPVLAFEPDAETCTEQADAVLARNKITFLSGSDRLDATSIRAINAIAAVAKPCLDAGLMLEIGGHTDSTGSEEINQALSFDRANAVLTALLSRDLDGAAMTAVGYGQSEPIADNETEEGRAANRRTTLRWTSPEGEADGLATDEATDAEGSADAGTDEGETGAGALDDAGEEESEATETDPEETPDAAEE